MATRFKACSVEGCNGNAHYDAAGRRGWCSRHYRRWVKYGGPLAGGTGMGDASRYFEEVVLIYEGDECFFWPFAHDSFGYGKVQHEGEVQRVHVLVCEASHGPKSSPDQLAAHSCGNGHLGCVARRHLSWKTHAGNMLDMVEQGRSARGEKNGCAKLNEDQVRRIRRLKGSYSQRQIGEMFGVSASLINYIFKEKLWKHLPDQQPREGAGL